MHWPTPLLSLRGRIALRVSSAPYLTKWLVLGVLIGAVAGLGAIAFVTLLELSTHFLLGVVGGYTPPSPANEGGITAAGHFARPWAIPLVVGLGGLISGLLVYRFAPEASGHGTDAAIAAVHNDPKGIRPKTALVKIVASAITIGSGGSGGREGPTAQISAGFASFLARGFGLSQDDARIAVTIGMGAGIGAIFRTPLGGAVVGAEVLYRRDFETAAIVPGLIASIVGFVVFGAVEGFAPIFGYHEALRFDQPIQLVYYALIGVAAALVGLLYDKAFWTTHDLFGRSRWPRWLLPAVGGLLVGCIALLFPQVLGTGYGWVQQMMTRPGLMSLSLWLVLLLPLAKILATSLSIGSGGSGGIFGPGMVIGALVGAGVWRVLEAIAPGVPLSPAPFVIVGMMASFGSIGHIPIATMLMVAEMTGNLSLLAPAMVAVGIATLIVGDRHIYHSQLASREDAPAHRFRFGLTPVGALPLATVMQDPPLVLQADEPALDALERVGRRGSRVGAGRRPRRSVSRHPAGERREHRPGQDGDGRRPRRGPRPGDSRRLHARHCHRAARPQPGDVGAGGLRRRAPRRHGHLQAAAPPLHPSRPCRGATPRRAGRPRRSVRGAPGGGRRDRRDEHRRDRAGRPRRSCSACVEARRRSSPRPRCGSGATTSSWWSPGPSTWRRWTGCSDRAWSPTHDAENLCSRV